MPGSFDKRDPQFSILLRPERHDASDLVKALYQTLLGRAAEPEGLDFYVHELNAGAKITAIARALRFSKEGRLHSRSFPQTNVWYLALTLINIPVVGKLIARTLHNKFQGAKNLVSQRKKMQIGASAPYSMDCDASDLALNFLARINAERDRFS